jgi:hypothetical protein
MLPARSSHGKIVVSFVHFWHKVQKMDELCQFSLRFSACFITETLDQVKTKLSVVPTLKFPERI